MDFEFEISGLKLKIKGDPADASGKVAELQRQVQSLMSTINSLAQQGTGVPVVLPRPDDDSPTAKLLQAGLEPTSSDNDATSNGTRRRQLRKNTSSTTRHRADAIDFKHDADQYGFPKQNWTTAQKAMWMIYVLAEQGEEKEFSAAIIAATFNKHFKSFGTILAQNVLRDLGKEKGKSGAVNSDASQDPMKWYLLEAGKKQIPALIEEAKRPSTE